MRLRAVAIAVTMSACLALPVSSGAQDVSVGEWIAPATFNTLTFGVTSALRTWGANPPCGVPSLVAVADGTVSSPAAPDAAAEADPAMCQIRYEQRLLTDVAPDVVCAVIVHEYGHLWGLGHSPSPFSPMYDRALSGAQAPACGNCIYLRQTLIHGPPQVRHGKRVRLAWARFRYVLHLGC